jgi:anti-sigma factor RsiW
MRCEEAREQLSAFQDDELDPVRSREIEDHLEGCPVCAEDLAGMKRVSERLRAEAPYHRASDALRTRVSQAAWRDTSRGRVAKRRWGVPARGWLSAAAAVLIAVVGVGMFASLQREGSAATEREVVSSHIRSLMASHLTDIASTDQHTVKPWFSGKLDFSPPVTDLAAAGYPLIGGRLDYLNGRPVAALVYQRRKHWINVFTWPDERASNRETPARTRQGYHVVHEARGGNIYWIVSDLNPTELTDFARLLVADAER